jgi:hypothetical protein
VPSASRVGTAGASVEPSASRRGARIIGRRENSSSVMYLSNMLFAKRGKEGPGSGAYNVGSSRSAAGFRF